MSEGNYFKEAKKYAEEQSNNENVYSIKQAKLANLAECFLALLKECEEYKKTLEMVVHDCENCDYHCERCGNNQDAKEFDLYLLAREVLEKWKKEKT